MLMSSLERDRDLTVNVRINPDKLHREYGIDPDAQPIWTIAVLVLTPIVVALLFLHQ